MMWIKLPTGKRRKRLMYFDPELIRRRMIAFRKLHKMTKTSFAAKVGMSLIALSRLERSKTAWTLDKLDAVAVAFNLKREEALSCFIAEDSPPSPETAVIQYILSSVFTFLKKLDLETLEHIKSVCQRYLDKL